MHDRLVSRRIDALHQCFLVGYLAMHYRLIDYSKCEHNIYVSYAVVVQF